jgi:hypothetical protein
MIAGLTAAAVKIKEPLLSQGYAAHVGGVDRDRCRRSQGGAKRCKTSYEMHPDPPNEIPATYGASIGAVRRFRHGRNVATGRRLRRTGIRDA